MQRKSDRTDLIREKCSDDNFICIIRHGIFVIIFVFESYPLKILFLHDELTLGSFFFLFFFVVAKNLNIVSD